MRQNRNCVFQIFEGIHGGFAQPLVVPFTPIGYEAVAEDPPSLLEAVGQSRRIVALPASSYSDAVAGGNRKARGH